MKKISEISELDRRIARLPTEVPEGRLAVLAQSLLCRKKIQHLFRLKAGLAAEEKVCPEVVLRVMHNLGADQFYSSEDVAAFLHENMAHGASAAAVEAVLDTLREGYIK